MKEFLKKNFVILLAFILPIALMVIVATGIYYQSLLISTDYDFIYTHTNYYDEDPFSVENGKLRVNAIDSDCRLRIFLYDTPKNESREMTLEEAQELTLNGQLRSPDGVYISLYKNTVGGVLPFTYTSYKYQLQLQTLPDKRWA